MTPEERLVALETESRIRHELYKEALKLAREALAKDVDLARSAIEHRLESMNEFRMQLKDQAGTFVTREDHKTVINAINNTRNMVYIGLGVMLAIQFLYPYLKH